MRILIVDDSKTMRTLVRRSLRQAGFDGFDVAEASDGREALVQMKAKMPDLILSDWNMPVLDGYELLCALRKAKINIPFGFVTAQSTPEMRHRARGAGARFLITKPFDPEDFKTHLSDLIPN